MPKIIVYCPSKPKEPYKALIEELAKRSKAKLFFGKPPKLQGFFKVLLDLEGEQLNNEELAKLVWEKEKIAFIVGGPEGIEAEHDLKLSLGKLLLSYQVALIVLLEAIFRALNPRHPFNKH